MSYILDALKKAEAERNTTVSGPLLARPASPAAFAPPVGQRRLWPWLALAVSAGALIGAVWLLTSAPPPAAAPAVVAHVAPPVPAPMPAVDKQQAQPASASAAQAQDEVQDEAPVKAKTVRKAAIKKAAATSTASAAASTTTVSEPVAPLHELPDAIRQQIPTLKVGGYIYSANKADRSVLINNRLLREGDEAAPGVTLERMLPDGMVLSYKGTRYRMNY